MVEAELTQSKFLTFTKGDKTAQVIVKDNYTVPNIQSALNLLGIKRDLTRIYPTIREFAPNSKTSGSEGRFVHYKLSPEDFTAIINDIIEKSEHRKPENVRPYVIDITNETVIELRGITDNKWKIYEPLLDMLRKTRKQTESGEIQTISITYKEVKSIFPKNTLDSAIIYADYPRLNNALAPSGWSIIREGKKYKIPMKAPWYLSGPDENGDQKNGQATKPKQENIYETSVNEQRKRIAEKQFDRIDYGTKLLHSWLTHHTNPDAKKFFTTNLEEFMSNYLPPDLKLERIIGKKTPKEAFQELIGEVLKSMEGKTYEELSEIQKPILPMWNSLKKQSGQHPKTIILESFITHDSNSPSDEVDNETDNSEEVVINQKPA